MRDWLALRWSTSNTFSLGQAFAGYRSLTGDALKAGAASLCLHALKAPVGARGARATS